MTILRELLTDEWKPISVIRTELRDKSGFDIVEQRLLDIIRANIEDAEFQANNVRIKKTTP